MKTLANFHVGIASIAMEQLFWDETAMVDGQGGRLKNIAVDGLQNLSYLYDPFGNIKQITNSLANETNTYTYDELDRLTRWTLNTALQEEYEYDPNTGNLKKKAGVTLSYPTGANPARPHAVLSTDNGTSGVLTDDNSYGYDANGNMTSRVIDGQTYTLGYDAENRLVSVTGPSLAASFVYDGDGRRVQSIINGVTTTFVGNHYEVSVQGTESTITKYYFAGTQRIAMRVGAILTYILSDHLGSTSLTTDAAGNQLVETRYKPWGEVRSVTPNSTLQTRYTFTGQYSHVADEATDLGDSGFGLLFFNARWYDPALGRFNQPDSIIPGAGDPQAWDRYAYGLNNPSRYTDPSGHMPCEDEFGTCLKPRTKNYKPPQPPIGPGGGKACSEENSSILCLSPKTSQPTLPILPLQPVIPSVVPSYEGYSDPKLESGFWFYKNVASPFFDFLEAYDVYKLHSKGGYKAARYSLPLGLVEGVTAAMEQSYRDSWYQSLHPTQRVIRPLVVGGEAIVTDSASNLAGLTGGTIGLTGGPGGAAIAYWASSAVVTKAADRFWMKTINPTFFSFLGVWP